MNNLKYDVFIIGGSYSGLSAAMSLGRSLRKVLVIDSGKTCNRFTPHSHNFLTQDGKIPTEISNIARHQVSKYNTVDFHNEKIEQVEQIDNGFQITLDKKSIVYAKKLIIATGIKDIIPDMDGFEECWGKSVIHCPYCHGYEFKDQPTGILSNSDIAFHYAQLVSNLTDKLTIFTNGQADFNTEQTTILANRKLQIIEKKIKSIKHQNGSIQHLIFEDGSYHSLSALYYRADFEQHSGIAKDLGCKFTDQNYIDVSNTQKTSVESVYAIGDSCSPMRSVANAVYSGNMAGAAVNAELCTEAFN